MARRSETFLLYNYDALQVYDNTCQGVYCLTDREISIILSALRFAEWPSRWEGSSGKLLRDDGRDADLQDALDKTQALIAKLVEC
jgi:hypothetical protein